MTSFRQLQNFEFVNKDLKREYIQRMLFAAFTNEMLIHKLVLQLLGLEPRPLPLAIMTQTLWSAVPSFSRADLALNYPSPFSP